jgi:hypothetical protein
LLADAHRKRATIVISDSAAARAHRGSHEDAADTVRRLRLNVDLVVKSGRRWPVDAIHNNPD